MQGSTLDGHKLVLQLSTHKGEDSGTALQAKAKDGYAAAKLVVRNVAFEATRKDLAGLFGPFGQLKSCRLPKKFDGSHRYCHIGFICCLQQANTPFNLGCWALDLCSVYAADESAIVRGDSIS